MFKVMPHLFSKVEGCHISVMLTILYCNVFIEVSHSLNVRKLSYFPKNNTFVTCIRISKCGASMKNFSFNASGAYGTIYIN